MDMKHLLSKLDSIGQKKTKVESTEDMKRFVSIVKDFSKPKQQGVAEGIDIGREWMSDTELDQYVPDDLQQEWRELVGYDEDGNAHPLWANMTGDYEPDASDPQHRAWMVKVANKWFAMKKIPNVRFFDVRDLDDELEWLVQIGDQGVEEASDWGDPREILEDVLQTLEREVEWPLTEVMDPREVKQLLAPIIKAVNERMMNMKESWDDQGVEEGSDLNHLASISDHALDKAYGYGRSTPGNSFGWQANLKSAEFAKRMIDAGVTDIEKISDAIHKGWNVTAQEFVKNPDQFDDTKKLKAAGKLEAKLQQRAKLMKINYSELPDDEKEKDRVVARALLQALKGDNKEESLGERISFKDYLNLVEAKKKITAKEDPCWKGYKMVGTKKKGGREVPNCVPGKKGD